jgi:hypothetical protein
MAERPPTRCVLRATASVDRPTPYDVGVVPICFTAGSRTRCEEAP